MREEGTVVIIGYNTFLVTTLEVFRLHRKSDNYDGSEKQDCLRA